MKLKQQKTNCFQPMSRNMLALIKGGDNKEEEYEIIYINGIPYRIRKDKNGEYTSTP